MSAIMRRITTVLGRFCLSVIFLASGVGKLFDWSGTAENMRAEGMVVVPFFLVMSIVFEIGGALSVLLGYWARLGALALVTFLVPVTLIFHDFWFHEGAAVELQLIHFLKNTAILGGLLLVLAHGAGPGSFDARSPRNQGSSG